MSGSNACTAFLGTVPVADITRDRTVRPGVGKARRNRFGSGQRGTGVHGNLQGIYPAKPRVLARPIADSPVFVALSREAEFQRTARLRRPALVQTEAPARAITMTDATAYASRQHSAMFMNFRDGMRYQLSELL